MPMISEFDRSILKHNKNVIIYVFCLSGCVNFLMLTGAIYMLQVYDRVLLSRSGSTLFFITLMMLILYVALYFFDVYRQKMLAIVGRDIEEQLTRPLFHVSMHTSLRRAQHDRQNWAVRDLEEVGRFMAGSGLLAIFDLPWMPMFVIVCFLFHPLIGLITVGAMLVVIALTVAGEMIAKRPTREVTAASRARQRAAESAQRGAEVAEAMGFGQALANRFIDLSREYHRTSGRLATLLIEIGTMTRTIRIAIQSFLLGIAAWLVINDQATPGVMIASSIIASRALAPIDLLVGRWRSIIQARDSWGRIKQLLEQAPAPSASIALPLPQRDLTVEKLAVGPSGSPNVTVRNVTFSLSSGDVLGVIGPSGSGKSTLVRGISGVWAAAAGQVRLDGALLEQYPPDQRAQIVGYLPQDVQLITGTVAENIARFNPNATPPQIIDAAKMAGAHDMILTLPSGYATPVGEEGLMLSGGQRQRIGLARALFGQPFLLQLDEPNSNLDSTGEKALIQAIRQAQKRGAIVVLVAHRLNMLEEVNKLLLVVDGEMRAFGNRDDVLATMNRTGQTALQSRNRSKPAEIALQQQTGQGA